MYVIVDDEVWVLADHILLDHEREMPGYWTFEQLTDTHREMHDRRRDWEHRH